MADRDQQAASDPGFRYRLMTEAFKDAADEADLRKERMQAAVTRIHRVRMHLAALDALESNGKERVRFPTELRLLAEALDLLDPTVKLA